MDTRTREALEASIKHWEENAVAEIDDVSIKCTDCALCNLFFLGECFCCENCPVRIKTNRSYCDDTPYHAACRELDGWHHAGTRDTFQEAARAEVTFLKSLRPVETE